MSCPNFLILYWNTVAGQSPASSNAEHTKSDLNSGFGTSITCCSYVRHLKCPLRSHSPSWFISGQPDIRGLVEVRGLNAILLGKNSYDR